MSIWMTIERATLNTFWRHFAKNTVVSSVKPGCRGKPQEARDREGGGRGKRVGGEGNNYVSNARCGNAFLLLLLIFFFFFLAETWVDLLPIQRRPSKSCMHIAQARHYF